LAQPFQKAWKEIMGTEFNNDPIFVNDDAELDQRYPTLIFQLRGDVASNAGVLSAVSNKNMVPLAKFLDPDNPFDVLLAVTPSQYFEFQQDSQKYIPGLYFDEPSGSVLGANVMMLHDIYFDIERNRIGWAESSCDFSRVESDPGNLPVSNQLLRIRSQDILSSARDINVFVINLSPTILLSCTTMSCHLIVATILASFFVVFLVVLAWLSKRRRTMSHSNSSSKTMNSSSTRRGYQRLGRHRKVERAISDDGMSNMQSKRGSLLRARSHQVGTDMFRVPSA
jgi:hypothetical protein